MHTSARRSGAVGVSLLVGRRPHDEAPRDFRQNLLCLSRGEWG